MLRPATAQELNDHLSRLNTDAINREWLAVEVAQSPEAATHLVGSVMVQPDWI
ncbi:DUF4214 domain-containing protein [Nitrosomonas sp. JL21]|uniref:DUF4214 domain-containing protein n=1 Tax=Nitrosomonas sp. JL21 TaxID=153949 RepID=UPI00136ED8FC|nr:DUF4214 domain-containing protein [Nitrosomonas sp. JL21]MBL8496363.1 hypothetical protein [Nitrosomonas sp.]